MYVVSVTVRVDPAHGEDFIRATLDNARNTRAEVGNARFDVLQSVDDAAHFQLYEVYVSEDAFKAHQQTAHYLRWKEAVAGWMAGPRTKVTCRNLFPTERSAW